MFESDKAPYFFTLIVAMLGWSVSRALDRITSGPVLAYEMSQRAAQGADKDLTVVVENLTGSVVYRDLNFFLTNLEGEGAEFKWADVEYPPPIWPETLRRAPSTVSEGIATFGAIPRLQPGSRIRLRAQHTGSNVPTLRLDAPNDAVRLISGWGPTLIRNELAVLFSLIAIWTAIIVIYMRALFATRPGRT